MTRIDDMLSRALLVRERHMPRDTVPPTTTSPHTVPTDARPLPDRASSTAADDLRALCETLVTHTPSTAVTDFVTEQVPGPRSALVLACVLQLTGTDDGARFWWQYAAGAGETAAAYCLHLHHLALGDGDLAGWWFRQIGDTQLPPDVLPQEHHPNLVSGPASDPDPVSDPASDPGPASAPDPVTAIDPDKGAALPSFFSPLASLITNASTTTILQVLRRLGKGTVRPRSSAVAELMAYIPTAVAAGYLRWPEVELPTPGPDFASRINGLLTEASPRTEVRSVLPTRQPSSARHPQTAHSQ
ncbi:hypothetical protein [Streptomyces olivaceiscleroticus]|uniref:Condensation domain-containing protein n=1 Tax=Streptomyces olivaceiscleroticus TaxID=68245 RepID=A0ABN1A2T8_9ACTN